MSLRSIFILVSEKRLDVVTVACPPCDTIKWELLVISTKGGDGLTSKEVSVTWDPSLTKKWMEFLSWPSSTIRTFPDSSSP